MKIDKSQLLNELQCLCERYGIGAFVFAFMEMPEVESVKCDVELDSFVSARLKKQAPKERKDQAASDAREVLYDFLQDVGVLDMETEE
jgi:hypothetical protein